MRPVTFALVLLAAALGLYLLLTPEGDRERGPLAVGGGMPAPVQPDAPVLPDGPREDSDAPASEAEPSGSESAPPPPRGGRNRPERSLEGQGRGGRSGGVIRGRAHPPAGLEAALGQMGIHVTRVEDLTLGSSTESYVVPAAVDATGRFELSGLAPGRYTLQLVLDGQPISAPRSLTLDRGRVVSGVDLLPGGRVTAEGQVLSDVTNGPVEGASIRVGRDPLVFTDGNGRFAVHDLEPGKHELLVLHPAHAPARAQVEVDVAGHAPPLLVRLVRGVRARVRVHDVAGRPASGVTVQFSGRDHALFATSDAQGWATVEGLEPGAHYVVELAGPQEGQARPLLVKDPEGPGDVTLEIRD